MRRILLHAGCVVVCRDHAAIFALAPPFSLCNGDNTCYVNLLRAAGTACSELNMKSPPFRWVGALGCVQMRSARLSFLLDRLPMRCTLLNGELIKRTCPALVLLGTTFPEGPHLPSRRARHRVSLAACGFSDKRYRVAIERDYNQNL